MENFVYILRIFWINCTCWNTTLEKKLEKKMEKNTRALGFEPTSTQKSSQIISTHHWPHSLKHLRIFELYHSNYFVYEMIYLGAKWDEILSTGAFLV